MLFQNYSEFSFQQRPSNQKFKPKGPTMQKKTNLKLDSNLQSKTYLTINLSPLFDMYITMVWSRWEWNINWAGGKHVIFGGKLNELFFRLFRIFRQQIVCSTDANSNFIADEIKIHAVVRLNLFAWYMVGNDAREKRDFILAKLTNDIQIALLNMQ